MLVLFYLTFLCNSLIVTAMLPLSQQLLAIIEAAPAQSSSLTFNYEQLIQNNTETLNAFNTSNPDASAVDRANAASRACAAIFKTRAVLPNDTSFKATEESNWSSGCWLPAASFVKCQSSLDVALTMSIINFFRSKFVVRGAGHNANPGFSSIGPEGVVIDVSSLDGISLSDDKTTAYVGPGATWDQVYGKLQKHNLTVVGGRVLGVGVGGLLVGGGMSHFSNAWGMACDNVKSFEVVTPESKIVNASADNNSNLFKVLKGGGSNFGIVTRFELYTNPNFEIWHTFKVYSAANSSAVMKAAVQVQKAMESDHRVGFFLVTQPSVFIAGMLYQSRCESPPSAFAAFDHIKPTMIAIPPTNGTQLSAAQAAAMPGHAKRKIGTATVRPDLELYVALQALLSRIVKQHEVNFTVQFTFQPLHGPTVNAQSQKRGGNMLNIPKEAQAWLGIIAEWEDDADDEKAETVMSELISGIHAEARRRKALIDWHFMNDANAGQEVLGGFGEGNLRLMREVSGKVDPRGMMGRLQGGGFLL